MQLRLRSSCYTSCIASSYYSCRRIYEFSRQSFILCSSILVWQNRLLPSYGYLGKCYMRRTCTCLFSRTWSFRLRLYLCCGCSAKDTWSFSLCQEVVTEAFWDITVRLVIVNGHGLRCFLFITPYILKRNVPQCAQLSCFQFRKPYFGCMFLNGENLSRCSCFSCWWQYTRHQLYCS